MYNTNHRLLYIFSITIFQFNSVLYIYTVYTCDSGSGKKNSLLTERSLKQEQAHQRDHPADGWLGKRGGGDAGKDRQRKE